MNPMPSTLTPQQIDRLARRRAGAKLGWYLHATAYVVVNLGLAALSLLGERQWFAYPLLGWGLGLAIHGAAVWLLAPGAPWRDRLVERERAALTGTRR